MGGRLELGDVRPRGCRTARGVDMIELRSARRAVLDDVQRLSGHKVVLADALGCTTVEALQAPEDVPRFANSAMDGYAVRAADTAGPVHSKDNKSTKFRRQPFWDRCTSLRRAWKRSRLLNSHRSPALVHWRREHAVGAVLLPLVASVWTSTPTSTETSTALLRALWPLSNMASHRSEFESGQGRRSRGVRRVGRRALTARTDPGGHNGNSRPLWAGLDALCPLPPRRQPPRNESSRRTGRPRTPVQVCGTNCSGATWTD